MSGNAQYPSLDRIREMLELVLAGLDQLGLEQAALHVAFALESLSEEPSG